MDICKQHDITAFSEQNKMDKIVSKWHAVMTVDPIPGMELSNEWFFKTDPAEEGDKDQWALAAANYSDGNKIRSDAGNGWESQGYAGYYGYAWYFQTLELPEDYYKAEHIYLFFGSIDTESWIYINGELVYEHSIASTGLPASALWNQPFAFDAKKYLKPGQPNKLAVKVYSSSGMAGIYRPATIYPADREYTAAELDQ